VEGRRPPRGLGLNADATTALLRIARFLRSILGSEPPPGKTKPIPITIVNMSVSIMSHVLARSNFRSYVGQRCVVEGDTYTLCGKIGDGAVGIVRKATRSRDNRAVAIKFLAPDPKYIEESSFDDVARRFEHEGKRGSKLEHERLVKILGHAQNENAENFGGDGPANPFLIMEYVAERTLESEIRATDHSEVGRFNLTRASFHCDSTCRCLGACAFEEIGSQRCQASQYFHLWSHKAE
jgi:serine/threonine protein kinase